MPGAILLSNACFVEDAVRMLNAGVGLVVVMTTHNVLKDEGVGKTRIVRHPFRDSEDEPEETIVASLRAAILDIETFWLGYVGAPGPPPPVLIHCSAGQNRSAALLLATLMHYGVDPSRAWTLVSATSTGGAPGNAVEKTRLGEVRRRERGTLGGHRDEDCVGVNARVVIVEYHASPPSSQSAARACIPRTHAAAAAGQSRRASTARRTTALRRSPGGGTEGVSARSRRTASMRRSSWSIPTV